MASEKKRIFGKYEYIGPIAKGGMAEIWKARVLSAEGFERIVAIKQIHPTFSEDDQFLTMFIDEAKIVSTLSHSNIVKITGFGEINKTYYHEMEHIDGSSLKEITKELIKKETVLPLEYVCYIISEVCKGLDYAHKKCDLHNQPLNIIHRDISPQNIMISYQGEIKIIDWGIAKARGKRGNTDAGIIKGKLGYMSPEQAEAQRLDHRSDIFSVGLVFYELLTGKMLVKNESPSNVFSLFTAKKKSPSADLNINIPQTIKSILDKALKFNPKDRYASAEEIHNELNMYLHKNYPAFTPTDLANFMKQLFTKKILDDHNTMVSFSTNALNTPHEIMQQKEISQVEMSRGGITKISSNAVFEDELNDIMDDPDKTKQLKTASRTTDPTQPVVNESTAEVPLGHTDSLILANRKSWGWLKITFLLLIIAVLAAGSVKWFHQYLKDQSVEKQNHNVADAPIVPPPVIQTSTPVIIKSAGLFFNSKPTGADIFIDGKNIGKTPFSVKNLEPGKKISFEFRLMGYKNYGDSIIPKSESDRFDVALSPDPLMRNKGFVTIDTSVPCLIYLDGKLISKYQAISDYPVKAGWHKFTFVNKKYAIRSAQKIRIKAGQKSKRNISFQRERRVR